MDATTLAVAMAWMKKQPDSAAASAQAAAESAAQAAELVAAIGPSTQDDVAYILGE